MQGLEFMVQGSGCRIQGSGFRVQGAGVGISGWTLIRAADGVNAKCGSGRPAPQVSNPPSALTPNPYMPHPSPYFLHPTLRNLHPHTASRAWDERLGGRLGGMHRRSPANPPPFPEPYTFNPEGFFWPRSAANHSPFPEPYTFNP